MINKLKQKSELLKADIVVIENQPVLKNPTMKSIQMVLYSFFLKGGWFGIISFSEMSILKPMHWSF